MKTAYIIHGWGGSPKEPMHQWLKKQLTLKRVKAVAPAMPHPEHPTIKDWIGKLKKIVKPNKDTYFIGHSIGCQAILRYLETIDTKIGGIVLIAPWTHLDEQTIKEEGETSAKTAQPWVETPINLEKVRMNVTKKTICIFSDNDPYVPSSETELFKERLDAEIFTEHNKGHFTEEDGVMENKLALKKILELMRE